VGFGCGWVGGGGGGGGGGSEDLREVSASVSGKHIPDTPRVHFHFYFLLHRCVGFSNQLGLEFFSYETGGF